MFFPAEEYPTEAVEQELQQLGVMCSVLPDLVPTYAVNNSSKQLTDSEGKRLAGFSMKSAAVLLSSFEEVHCCLFGCCSKMSCCTKHMFYRARLRRCTAALLHVAARSHAVLRTYVAVQFAYMLHKCWTLHTSRATAPLLGTAPQRGQLCLKHRLVFWKLYLSFVSYASDLRYILGSRTFVWSNHLSMLHS